MASINAHKPTGLWLIFEQIQNAYYIYNKYRIHNIYIYISEARCVHICHPQWTTNKNITINMRLKVAYWKTNTYFLTIYSLSKQTQIYNDVLKIYKYENIDPPLGLTNCASPICTVTLFIDNISIDVHCASHGTNPSIPGVKMDGRSTRPSAAVTQYSTKNIHGTVIHCAVYLISTISNWLVWCVFPYSPTVFSGIAQVPVK